MGHPVFARVYARLSVGMEREVADNRRTLLEGLRGRVIEIGAGNGMNFRHYPSTVEELVAVEPEPYLRALAVTAAEQAPVRVQVVDGTADRLPVEPGFDAGVVSLVLCSVPDQASALAELFRVIRPGGELRFYEHVRAHNPALAAAQRAIEPLWSRLGGGCHLTRQTEAAIEEAGFAIERVERFEFAPSVLDRLAASHILGSARRP